jgi:hypothetical protein
MASRFTIYYRIQIYLSHTDILFTNTDIFLTMQDILLM